MASPGSLRVDAVDLSATNETGDGVVYVFEIECIAIGVSLIQLTDVSTGGGANAGILNTTEAFAVASETDGVVGCEVPAIAPVMGSISGTVTDEATGDPLADICVSAPGPGFGFAETDASRQLHPVGTVGRQLQGFVPGLRCWVVPLRVVHWQCSS